MFYNLAYLSVRANQIGPATSGLAGALQAATTLGRLIGCMSCDIGEINRVAVLSAYGDLAALQADRAATLGAVDPYAVSAYLSGIEATAFKKLDFVADIEPGNFGPFYEIRTYETAHGTLPQTEAFWAKLFERRNSSAKPLVVMTSVDTSPTRVVHIWPYRSLDDRAKLRTDARRLGYWPPPGGTGHLLSLRSEIFTPLPGSPLR